jgi:ATP-binding cassette subfamily B protein
MSDTRGSRVKRADTQLGRRFPSLRLLRLGPRSRRIPHIHPINLSACGPACLTSVLHYHGKHVQLKEVCDACGSGPEGTSALALIEAAREFGLRGRAVSLDFESLALLAPGSILFWGFNHFVVFERQRRNETQVVDPNAGVRRIPVEECRRMFTGVAILFDRIDAFEAERRGRSQAWKYFQRILSYRALLGRILVTSVVLQVLGLGLPVLTGVVVDRVVPLGDVSLLQVLALGCMTIAACYFVTSLLRSHLILHLRTYLDAQMTLGFLEHLVQLPYSFFERRSAGDLMMRLNSNTFVREIITSSALSGVLDGVLVFTYLFVLLVASPVMGLVVLGLAIIRIGIFLVTKNRIRDLTAESLARQAGSQSYQVQMFAGMETLKASGAERRAVEKWSHLFVDYLNVSLRQSRLGATVQAASDCLTYLSPLVILSVGALLVVEGKASLGAMLSTTALGVGFLLPLASLIGTGVRLQELNSYMARLVDVLEERPEHKGLPSTRGFRLQGEITLESVTFRHGPGLPFAVQDVSMSIKAGQKVAIVGRSGAGKSTLAKLITGLYIPESGAVFHDHTNLLSLDLRQLRAQIGTVVQQTYLFSGSIRENIALGNPGAPLQDVIRVAKIAHIHDAIMDMPMQYDAVVSPGGASLSGGERQRLALARALLNRPRVLILDEATSEVDLGSERRIQESLGQLDCTQVIIAHRLTTISSADEIIVFEKGRIAERGSHKVLMDRHGVYAQLLASQETLRTSI